MPIEVKTRLRMPSLKNDRPPEVIIDLVFIPRGSGNRNKARKWAEAFRKDPTLGPYVIKAVAGASRVSVHLEASFKTMRAIETMREQAKAGQDVEGQLPLFAAAI